MRTPDDRKQIHLRLSPALHARVAHAAVDAHTTFGPLVEALLVEALAARESHVIEAALAWGEDIVSSGLDCEERLADAVDEYRLMPKGVSGA